MINGNNASGKLFEVLDEEFELLGAFDTLKEASACSMTAHWMSGNITIRRDIDTHERQYAASKKLPRIGVIREYFV